MNFAPLKPFNDLPDLPPKDVFLQSPENIARLVAAHRGLAELKGSVRQLPNVDVILNAVTLYEAKDSSEIENIVTTQDELFQAAALQSNSRTAEVRPDSAKEVIRYREAMTVGLEGMQAHNLITTTTLEKIVQTIKANDAGVRTIPVVIANPRTGAVIYTPPGSEQVIRDKLHALEQFIHEDDEMDSLIKLAMIHYQFEAIHPFLDGNGRTGRILNTLFLVQQRLLDHPILYLSSFVLRHRSDYYRLLRGVTEQGNWLDWTHFILDAIEETARLTLNLVGEMSQLMTDVSVRAKREMTTGYSVELIHTIFQNPYCKIQHLVDAGIASRITASKYLSELDRVRILRVKAVHRNKYFMNEALLSLLSGFGKGG